MRRISESLKRLEEDFKKLQELGRAENLAEWNRVQYGLWLELVKRGMFKVNDIGSFSKFAEFFYDYFDEYHKVPTVREVQAYFV